MKLKKQYDCNLVMMNDLIGGKWKLRILWHIMNGDNRFSMLEKTIDSITRLQSYCFFSFIVTSFSYCNGVFRIKKYSEPHYSRIYAVMLLTVC